MIVRGSLALFSFLMLQGSPLIALAVTLVIIFLIRQATQKSTTKDLDRWMVITVGASVGSFSSKAVLFFAARIDRKQSYFAHILLWIFGKLMEKAIGAGIGYILYKDYMKEVKAENAEAAKPQFLDLVVTVQEGRELVAKDSNIWGKAVSSDPYVEVCHGQNRLGKTAIVKKTLNPVWTDETFEISVLPRMIDYFKTVEFNIFDHDKLSANDPMGTVYVPIPTMRNRKIRKWYRVEKGEGDNYCRNATGELLIEIELKSESSDDFRQALRMESTRLLNEANIEPIDHSKPSVPLKNRKKVRASEVITSLSPPVRLKQKVRQSVGMPGLSEAGTIERKGSKGY